MIKTLGKPETTTLLSPPFKFALKTRVTSANPEYRLTEVILVSFLEDTSTTFITVLESLLCISAIGGQKDSRTQQERGTEIWCYSNLG